MVTETSNARIITFYSYTGGTGRSMALANVAWILAGNGKRVLAIDWDLEAPGLHRYFYPFLTDNDLTASQGVIDFVVEFVTKALTPSENLNEQLDEQWYEDQANITRFAVSLNWPFPETGTLDFVPAGRQDELYSRRVNSFTWADFYERFSGGTFLELVKKRMRAEYDYILIDSRTGVSDTSGICTVQMPDDLVICYTLNNQSIGGAAGVANSILAQRPDVRVFPVPMRIEPFEKKKVDLRKEYAQREFAGFPHHMAERDREKFGGEVQFPYVPYYAYEEILATFGDKPGETNTILVAVERLTSYLTDGKVISWVYPSAVNRQEILDAYEQFRLTPRDKPRRRIEPPLWAR